MADILTTIGGTAALLGLIAVAEGNQTPPSIERVREFVRQLPEYQGRIRPVGDALLHASANVYNEDALTVCLSSYTAWAEEIAKGYVSGEELALRAFDCIDKPRKEQVLRMAEALANEAGLTGREQAALAKARTRVGPPDP